MKVGVTCDGQGLDALAHEARRSNAGSAKRSILKMLRSPFHIMLAVLWFWNSYTIHCCCSRKTIHLAYLELVHYLSIYTTFYLIGPSIAFNLSFIGLSVSFIHISRSILFNSRIVLSAFSVCFVQLDLIHSNSWPCTPYHRALGVARVKSLLGHFSGSDVKIQGV